MNSLTHTLIFLDVEATGLDAEDRIIQVAYQTTDDQPFVDELYKPNLPIKIEAMAVHHITEKMVEHKPAFKGSKEWHDLAARFDAGNIFIAHNAPFDAGMLEKEDLCPTKIIDTIKIARHLDPDGKIKSYQMQYLRYLLGIEVEATAHDAKGDVLVLEQLFYRLLKKMMELENISADTAIDQMIEITKKPILYKFFPFGKHKNKSVEDVAKEDPGYLQWLLKTKKEEEPEDVDWVYTLEYYLNT